MTATRIVITGIGGICGLGNNARDIWKSMIEGRSGFGPVPELRGEVKTTICAPVRDMPVELLDPRLTVTMGRFTMLTLIAAHEAVAQSGMDFNVGNPARRGAIIGTGIYGADTVDDGFFDLLVDGKKRPHIFSVPRAMPGAPAGQVSMRYKMTGPVFGVTSACSSANHAIATAADQLRLGRADVMIAGGTDTPITWGVIKGWESLRVLARESCRPFSRNRDGLVLGEGAGVVVLETLEHARARGAEILAELSGCGLSADASDIVSPTVEGPAASIANCLRDMGANPEDIDYINAHGTATQANDRIETQAIRKVFGSAAGNVSVSSTKSMHGHALGASGALEMIALVNSVREGIIPPTANYEEPDPECDLDVTPNTARTRKVSRAISNAFAFGGTNAVIGISRI